MSSAIPPQPSRGEIELIHQIQGLIGAKPSPTDPQVPFGDDMAALSPGAGTLLWTVDMLMDGVDFESARHDWQTIGRKSLAVNLSDCAAMAARPSAALVAVALNDQLSMEAALDIFRGIHQCAQKCGCAIVGGDTNSWSHPTAISITVAGVVPPGTEPVRRDRARDSDTIWLTGPVGGSILGRHLTFEPRVELALELNRRLAPPAMIDISDGLALDLGRILAASHCGGVLSAGALESAIHADAHTLSRKDGVSPRDHALHDGEDFELIVVLDCDADPRICADLGLVRIGRITTEPGLLLEYADGRCEPIPIRGWEHFR